MADNRNNEGAPLLDDLLASVHTTRTRIHQSHHPEVGHYIDVSARHVSAARLGARMFRDPASVGADGATAQTAALVLVSGSGYASFDLCATAWMRWHGLNPARANDQEREFDAGDMVRAINKRHLAEPTGEVGEWWKAVTTGQGKELADLRHAAVHRTVRHDSTVGGTPPVTVSAARGTPGTKDAADVLDDLAAFVTREWSRFWTAFVMIT